MDEVEAILHRARLDAEYADEGHCGCCENPDVNRIERQAMHDLAALAVRAIEAVREIDQSAHCRYHWDGDDECPLATATALRDDLAVAMEPATTEVLHG